MLFFVGSDTDDMSPYPTVVMVTTAHQKPSGIDLNMELAMPASAKYTVLLNRTTPRIETGVGIDERQ